MIHRIILPFIILTYILVAALYALYTPKWQAPDEPAHFNYIRAITETGSFPVLQSGDYDQDYLEKIKAAKFPASLSIDSIRYESYQPPLYYLAAAPFYFLARAGGLDAQVLALRFLGIALGATLLLVAYRAACEMFHHDPLLALATVGAIAIVPQHIAVTASISNDTAANLLVALILWLAVKRANNTMGNSRFATFGGILFGAALLTKTTAYIPGAFLLLGAEFARLRLSNSPITLSGFRFVFFAFLLALVIFAPWLIHGAFTYGIGDPLGIARHDAIVVGQPTTMEMVAQYGFNHIAFDYFAVTFKSFWAQFGWMGVLINDRLYVVLMVLESIALFGFILYTWKIFRRRQFITEAQHWHLGLIALLFVVSLVDFIAYNFKFFQLQGRYLFPALIPVALVLVLGLREIVNRAYERAVFAMLYLGMLGLDLICLFLYVVPQLRLAK